MNYITKVILGAILSTSIALAGPLDDKCRQFVANQYPAVTVQTHVEYVCHSKFSVAYDSRQKITIFVATRIDKEQLDGDVKRTDNFKVDPLTNPKFAVKPADYNRTIYDRGHFAESELFTTDKEAMRESFYMTNMHPQLVNFNRGIWKSLEIHTRKLARAHNTIFVISGTVYDKNSITIGRGVTVPESSWKVITIPSNNTVEAYMITNANHTGEKFKQYKVTVKEIEIATGLKF